MTGEELKDALIHGYPVVCDDPMHGSIPYEKVSAIKYWLGADGKIKVSAELLSYCGHSVRVARAEHIKKYTHYDAIRKEQQYEGLQRI